MTEAKELDPAALEAARIATRKALMGGEASSATAADFAIRSYLEALSTAPVALEAPKGWKWQMVPDYPEGDVVAACICGSWPGGKCLRCPVVEKVA